MNIRTKYHGEIEIQQEEVIEFPSGIPGFLEEKQFVVLRLEDESPFYILQSVQTPELAFVTVIPFHYFRQYEFDLDEKTLAQLKIQDENDVIVYTILTVKEPFEQTTANLQAPVIINRKAKLGKQVILTNTNYQTKHPLIQRVKEGV
ncbi:flagellar assembly protein FliW [Bacillus sp. FJAT-47783]|uniref:flagellar assembly protein FliW n=1 Tax=Bacillus sp. FJAT-47783 TaxID=2922712 RepID=UPI001FAE1D9D|nr:flagellar assembly protein FliW [Bacillus sp. FJAT-47783]